MSAPHRTKDEDEEARTRTVTTFACDYMYMTDEAEFVPKKEEIKHRALGKPIMVEYDRVTGAVFGHQAQCKGATATWIPKTIDDDIVECGFGGARIGLRSDQENPIKDVLAKVIVQRPEITVPEHSAVGDSQGNGLVENTCRRLQGMIRTLKNTVDCKIKVKINTLLPIFSWMIEWAGQLLTGFSVDANGKSPYPRMKGRRPSKPLAVFGELVHYLPLKSSSYTRTKFGDRMLEGVWLGLMLKTDENMIGTADGVVKARTVRRLESVA